MLVVPTSCCHAANATDDSLEALLSRQQSITIRCSNTGDLLALRSGGMSRPTLAGSRIVFSGGITDADVALLSRHSHLRDLSLEYCGGVTDHGIGLLQKHPSLRFLGLAGTNVTDDSVPNLLALPALKKLDIRETAITERGLSLLLSGRPNCIVLHGPTAPFYYAKLIRDTNRTWSPSHKGPERQGLALLGPTVTKESLPAPNELADLTSLSIHNTRLRDSEIADLLAKTPSLEVLSVEGHSLSLDVFRQVGALPKLILFKVTKGEVPDGGAAAIAKSKTIAYLNVVSTNIDDDDIAVFASMQNLAELDIAYTKITNAGLKRLHDNQRVVFVNAQLQHADQAGINALQEHLIGALIVSQPDGSK